MKPFPKTEKAKARERVAIAKDVLNQLVEKKIKAVTGTYFLARVKPKEGAEVCKLVQGRRCDVCAKGAVFKSMIDRYDRFKMPVQFQNQVVEIDADEFGDYVERLFGYDQLATIEHYFEGWYSSGFEQSYDAPVRWHDKHSSPRKRLRLIMENIIAHDGEFMPEALP